MSNNFATSAVSVYILVHVRLLLQDEIKTTVSTTSIFSWSNVFGLSSGTTLSSPRGHLMPYDSYSFVFCWLYNNQL